MVNLFYRMTFVVTYFLLSNLIFPQSQTISNPVVSKAIKMDVSQPMRDLPLTSQKTIENWNDGIIPLRTPFDIDVQKVESDGSLQDDYSPEGISSITKNFDGVSAGGYAPPDPSGDVGPNHYVQMVNVQTQIWDKNGNSLAGPFNNSNFWAGLPGPWSGTNDGDPIVLYDEIADRWMVSQFALPNYPNGPFYILIAVSTTSDPAGNYYQYAYSFPDMPDYPKFGIWPDGYYMSANTFASGSLNYLGTYATVFDRNTMLAGGAATMQNFVLSNSTWSLLPSDCDGAFPPIGSPNYFLATYNGFGGGNTNLDVYQFHVDWVTPANTNFTGPLLLTTPAFGVPDPIPQLGTTNTLDNLAYKPMNRLQYRNFGDHQSMVVCQTVNAGSGRAGMRWWELRKTSDDWSIYQEGTYAPSGGLYRWMGSIAMDESGNIALGYSTSGSTIYPDIRFTGRFASDPLGIMTIAETVIHAGGGSQTGSLSRWGDYTQMVVDPTESGTFWYTNEYIPTSGWLNWKTRIAAFNFDTPCPVGYASNPSPLDGTTDVSINLAQLNWQNGVGTNDNELYFGTDPVNLPLVQSGSLAANWNIPSLPLEYSTNYYWYVVENGDTCSVTGPTWSFKTEPDSGLILSWADNFDNYTAGQMLACQNPTNWTTWSLSPCNVTEDATVTNAQSYSPPNSFVIVQNNDEVHPIGDLTYGKYSISFRVYIPTDKIGYFNTLSSFTGGVYEWAMECFFNAGGQGSLNAGGTEAASFSFAYDTWNLTELIVDIDNDAAEFKFNGTSIYSWPWSSGAAGSGGQLQLAGTDFFGSTAQDQMYIDDYTFTDLLVVSVEDSIEINDVDASLIYNLEQNYPNPFNPNTLIKYSVAEGGFVNVSIFNILGEKVATLVNNNLQTGNYEINFDASSLSSGVYFYSIESGDFKAVRKMIVMK